MRDTISNVPAEFDADVPAEASAGHYQPHEHTLGGKLIASIRDVWSSEPADPQQLQQRAQQNDMIAGVIANTAAMLPGPRLIVGAGLRALTLLDTDKATSAPAEALLDGAKNFAEGAALHSLARYGMREAPRSAAQATLARSIFDSQVGRVATMGLGTGAIQALDYTNWRDNTGAISSSSVLNGLGNVFEGAAIGAAFAVPTGLIGGKISAAAASRLVGGQVPSRLTTAAILSGSGLATGAITGGAESWLRGGSSTDVLSDAMTGGLIGMTTAGLTGAAIGGRAAALNPYKMAGNDRRFTASLVEPQPVQLASDRSSVVWGITDRLRTSDGHLNPVDAGHGKVLHYRYSSHTDRLFFMSENQAFKELASAIKHGGNSVGVYIPGLRNAPGQAASDAAKLSHRSGLPFVVLDWATSDSHAGPLRLLQQIKRDFRSARVSQPMINDRLSRVVKQLPGQKIVVAHSHGADKAIAAAASLARRGLKVDHTILAHPDVDVAKFAASFPQFCRGTGGITVTTSRGDRALEAHNLLHPLVGPTAEPRPATMLNGHPVPSGRSLGSWPITKISDFMLSVASGHVAEPDTYVTAISDTGPGPLGHGLDMETLALQVKKFSTGR